MPKIVCFGEHLSISLETVAYFNCKVVLVCTIALSGVLPLCQSLLRYHRGCRVECCNVIYCQSLPRTAASPPPPPNSRKKGYAIWKAGNEMEQLPNTMHKVEQVLTLMFCPCQYLY